MTIKQNYVELVNFLQANANKKVSSIMPEILAMTQSKTQSKTFLTNEQGDIIAIFCYYHKQWELLDEVPFGVKAHSTTGYNTMCKQGVSSWTKQNNAIKKVGETVLQLLENGLINASEISAKKDELIAEAKQIDTTNMPIGYATADEALEAYANLHA